jgi:glycerophosphoryl diester phosphodiesterase
MAAYDMAMARFDLQGHRGARGLKPENTLPGFEVAFDLGVTSVETDVHLTRDHVPVLLHDPSVPPRPTGFLVKDLTLARLRGSDGFGYRRDQNLDLERFPQQDAAVTPLAALYAQRAVLDPYTVLTVADLFAFAQAYAGELGAQAGKTTHQRERARQVCFDLELKRVPFPPDLIGDGFDGGAPALFEKQIVKDVREAGMIERTRVRSFDHRSVKAVRQLEPRIRTAVLIAETAPVAPAELVRRAGAQTYCPDFRFLDPPQVQQLHAEGIGVIAWTVNSPPDWEQLLEWGVDGITTDYPDQLATLLAERGIAF